MASHHKHVDMCPHVFVRAAVPESRNSHPTIDKTSDSRSLRVDGREICINFAPQCLWSFAGVMLLSDLQVLSLGQHYAPRRISSVMSEYSASANTRVWTWHPMKQSDP